MNKASFSLKIIITAVLLFFAVPAGLMYYYDSMKVSELNKAQEKILTADNQKEIDVIKAQLSKKIDEINQQVAALTPASVEKKFAVITSNNTIRNSSYSKKDQLAKIRDQFLKSVKFAGADFALLMPGGSVIEASRPALKSAQYKANTLLLQAVSSKKTMQEINFTAGTAEYFIPIIDVKDRLVSALYVKEDISVMAGGIRKNIFSAHGYNFIVNSSGTMLLNTDAAKENTENVLSNPYLKAVINEEGSDQQIVISEYNNLKGLLAYKKEDAIETITCVFTPYADYKSMQKKIKTYESSFLDTSFALPVYGWLAAALLAGIFLILTFSAQPFSPLRRIVKALTHIDEEGFQEMLPKIKKGEYKRLLDSLVILRGRVKASEEKAEKLSKMSKELEEELSKEASKSDGEISELRDAIKIAENNKATLEEEAGRLKNDNARIKKDLEQKLESEKSALSQKISALEAEVGKQKQEIKKSQESKVPVEKENMRMDSVLMMNTELKGVLSVIKTYISSVLGGEGKITDAQQQFLGVVINKSARLERLINDLTELARLEKDEIKLIKQKVDINTIVQDVIFAIQPQADIKKVELKVNFAPTLPTGSGDPGRLSSVTSQLLNQAIKVSPRGGQVIVETKETSKDVLIRITDFGMSMPQSKSNILFINFHGPESTAGPEFVNSGLRFPIIKAVINNMGGEIWIESEIGKGKTFIISLPKSGFASGKPEDGKAFRPDQAPAQARETIIKPGPQQGSEASGGFKIQRNDAGPQTARDESLPTVSDLLSFGETTGGGSKKVDLPGKDTVVPPELLKKTEPLKQVPGTLKKSEEQALPLPDELPPLPDLEDDKGIG